MRARAVSFALAPLLIAAASCWASAGGPPFITDDPEPVDFRHWEVYIASIDFHEFGAYSGTLPHLEVNYGPIPNLQLHLIVPMAFETAPGQPFEYGFGDTELGVKFRFMQETAHQPMAGVFPLVEVPTGNERRNLGVGSPAVFLPVWLQKSFGSWTAYGGGGFWHNTGPGNHDYWFQGIVIQCQTIKSLMVGLELFHSTPQVVGEGDITGFNIGGQYDFNDGHHLMLSVGTGLHGPDSGTLYAAYQWTFGPHEKEGGPNIALQSEMRR